MENYLVIVINDPEDRGENIPLSSDEQFVVTAVEKLGILSSSLGRRRHLFFRLKEELTRLQLKELQLLRHRSGCIVDFHFLEYPGKKTDIKVEQEVISVVVEGKEIRVSFSCGHSCLWLPLPGMTVEVYAEKMQYLVHTVMECPSCVAERFVQEQYGE